MKKKFNREQFLHYCELRMKCLTEEEILDLFSGSAVMNAILMNFTDKMNKLGVPIRKDVDDFIEIHVALANAITDAMIHVNAKKLREGSNEECY